MTWTLWRKLGLAPERVRSVHRINDDPPETQTLVAGSWATVPGDSLAHRDQDHLIEPMTEAELPDVSR
jgi:hypothetical protein